MRKLKKSGLQKSCKRVEKILIEYYITKDYLSYQILFKQGLLVNIITIYWPVILILIKQENFLVGNTIDQALEKILRSILKAATFVYYLKWSDISFIIIFNYCLC